ncbi:enoyl-CoA hydratase/isomerase family protein [Trinickia violacea]|nr:enoyl-CoA hydratase/isomerase family protein [Trinickia violacea]
MNMPMETTEAPSQGRVNCHVVNRVAILTLDRPHALNALSHDMVRELTEHVERCRTDDRIVALVLRGSGEKGFCAGGDVRALYHASRTSSPADATPPWQQFFIDEYRLDFALHAFPKPIVALMDGITMGGGMGLAQAATLRIATERSKIAMPETRIGFVPDVGATRFLSVMPVELELYVGLTGTTLTGADAVRCRLADACVPSEWLRTFEERLQRMPADDIERLERHLADVFIPPANVTPHAAIDAFMPLIVKHFAARLTVPEIAASLAADSQLDPPRELRTWLQATLDALSAHSPTMLRVTREALLRGRSMTLAECFRMELGIATRAIDEGDFREGVRAHLVDKDRQPRWQPATLTEVRVERERHFLRSPWTSDKHPLAELGALPQERASKLAA